MYFKFVKGRTFKPRVEVAVAGEWRVVKAKNLLQARVAVTNIGASKVVLLQKGTGLLVSRLASTQPVHPCATMWTSFKAFKIFEEHEWVEPGETVFEDILLHLGTSEPIITLFETRLVCRRSILTNITVFHRRIIPADSTISVGTDGTAKPKAGQGG